MPAANYDIITAQLSGLALTCVYKDEDGNPVDITGATPEFRITDNQYDETLDTYTGSLTTDGTDGSFQISIGASTVDGWGFNMGRYVIALTGVMDVALIYGKIQIVNV